jgi:hypothetical protein
MSKPSAALQQAIEDASLDAGEDWALPLLVTRLEEVSSELQIGWTGLALGLLFRAAPDINATSPNYRRKSCKNWGRCSRSRWSRR